MRKLDKISFVSQSALPKHAEITDHKDALRLLWTKLIIVRK